MHIEIKTKDHGTYCSTIIAPEDSVGIEDFIKQLASGESNYVSFDHKYSRIYFSKEVLSQSIITLVR